MHVDNELINQFLTGTVSVFLMVLIGGTLAHLLRSIGKQFTFTKSALAIALPPFCFSLSLDRGSVSTIYLFAIVMILLGYSIDGVKYIMLARRTDGEPSPATSGQSDIAQNNASEDDGKKVIWEKVE